jgi:uncharacterized protein YbjT (DUF2867 family)
MVLVVGATGLVGNEVCRRLAHRGERVRALVRETSAPEKVDALRSAGVELLTGDLKDPVSLDHACQGCDAVISTASSTLSRQAGDSIESVDAMGQLNLVRAAKNAAIERFVFVSYRPIADFPSPLSDAKRQVEEAISDMNFTVVKASWFMEVWLSPALGFNYASGSARILGTGTAPVSWVSYRDVGEICTLALRHTAAARKTIEFGGPEALPMLDVVSRFEAVSGKKFVLEHVPEEALRAQYEAATDSLSKSFAALMLGCTAGDAMNVTPVVEGYGIRLTSVDEYARSVLAGAARA